MCKVYGIYWQKWNITFIIMFPLVCNHLKMTIVVFRFPVSTFLHLILMYPLLYMTVGEQRAGGSRAEAPAVGEHAYFSQTTLHSVLPRTRA